MGTEPYRLHSQPNVSSVQVWTLSEKNTIIISTPRCEFQKSGWHHADAISTKTTSQRLDGPREVVFKIQIKVSISVRRNKSQFETEITEIQSLYSNSCSAFSPDKFPSNKINIRYITLHFYMPGNDICNKYVLSFIIFNINIFYIRITIYTF